MTLLKFNIKFNIFAFDMNFLPMKMRMIIGDKSFKYSTIWKILLREIHHSYWWINNLSCNSFLKKGEHKGDNSNKDTATGKEVNVSYNCFYKNTNAIKMVVVRYIGQS